MKKFQLISISAVCLIICFSVGALGCMQGHIGDANINQHESGSLVSPGSGEETYYYSLNGLSGVISNLAGSVSGLNHCANHHLELGGNNS
jgi:hypothetical protein